MPRAPHRPAHRAAHRTAHRAVPTARTAVRRTALALALLVLAALVPAVLEPAATAGTAPRVTALSTHKAVFWGGTQVTVTGTDFTKVRQVLFGATPGSRVTVTSPTRLTVVSPWHSKYSSVHVRVVTDAGTSPRVAAAAFTFRRPTLDDPIMGGLTARQEQRISAQVRAKHRTPATARKASRWTPAMGLTALRRAESWIGLPYSWAGGNGRGPTSGVCSHNGGDMDCHVVGFDCSGLALHAWAPYKTLVHYAATQKSRAGKYHPGIGELVPGDLVFFSGYISDGIGHVAVYAGNGRIVEAAESGTVVRRAGLAATIAADGVYRGAVRPASTGRQGSGPVVSSVTPSLRTSGGTITVTGRGLTSTTAVDVGGTLVYSFVSKTSSRLVLKAPAHGAGTVTVGVSNAWGTAKRTLTYVAPPSVSALTPATGPTAGGTTVRLTGRGLDLVTNATVDGVAVPLQHVSATALDVTVPAHAAGGVPVRVTSTWGTSVARTYTYAEPAPTGTPTTTPPTTPPTTGTTPAQPGTRGPLVLPDPPSPAAQRPAP